MLHADIRRILADNLRWFLTHEEPQPKNHRPYQFEALGRMTGWLEDPSGTRRGYLHHATGLGKTLLEATASRYAIGLRVLIVVPSKVLIVQTARVLHTHVGGMLGHLSSLDDIRNKEGQVICRRGSLHHSLVLTTDATLRSKAAGIQRDFDPNIILRDECHWGYSEASQAALARFPEAVIIGFSATPDYVGTVNKAGYEPVHLPQGGVLFGNPRRFARTHFGTLLDTRSARWGIDNGYLCGLAWGQLALDASLERVRIVDGPSGPDYEEAGLRQAMAGVWPKLCNTIADLYRDSSTGFAGRRAFAVCTSIEEAHQLADVIRETGTVRTDVVVGATGDGHRNEILERFDSSGEGAFIASVQVLREGWDSPHADICWLLRPHKTLVAYEQPLGRVLRLPEDNPSKVALVVDLRTREERFGALSVPTLYGRQGETLGGHETGLIIQGPGELRALPPLPEILRTTERAVTVPKAEHWARKDDTFAADGLLWATLDGMAILYHRDLRECSRILHPHLHEFRQRVGRDAQRKVATFYCVEDSRRVMGPLKVLPQAMRSV